MGVNCYTLPSAGKIADLPLYAAVQFKRAAEYVAKGITDTVAGKTDTVFRNALASSLGVVVFLVSRPLGMLSQVISVGCKPLTIGLDVAAGIGESVLHVCRGGTAEDAARLFLRKTVISPMQQTVSALFLTVSFVVNPLIWEVNLGFVEKFSSR